jgi:uncharacterized protein
VRRDAGVRVYARRVAGDRRDLEASPASRADALLAMVIAKYAPLPLATLRMVAARLRYAAPQVVEEIRPALARARASLAHANVGGVEWYWPAEEDALAEPGPEEGGGARVRFLAPFDPVVWDRLRFEAFWGWAYRFEAYTPVKKRKLGYYALPLLFRDQVIGWGNVAWDGSALSVDLGYVKGKAPRGRDYARALDQEVEAMRAFLKDDAVLAPPLETARETREGPPF